MHGFEGERTKSFPLRSRSSNILPYAQEDLSSFRCRRHSLLKCKAIACSITDNSEQDCTFSFAKMDELSLTVYS